jgi:hypothetical protein
MCGRLRVRVTGWLLSESRLETRPRADSSLSFSKLAKRLAPIDCSDPRQIRARHVVYSKPGYGRFRLDQFDDAPIQLTPGYAVLSVVHLAARSPSSHPAFSIRASASGGPQVRCFWSKMNGESRLPGLFVCSRVPGPGNERLSSSRCHQNGQLARRRRSTGQAAFAVAQCPGASASATAVTLGML